MGDVTFPANVLQRFNGSFPDLQEKDRDRYGLLTPGDILADGGDEASKAVRIRDYLTHAETVDIDGDPATTDVFVYRDASVVTLSIKVGDSFRPAFSMNFANPEDCFLTYPEDHYNTPIAPAQCRLVRAAHPFMEGLKSEYLKPAAWIREVDQRVLIPTEELSTANARLIKIANGAKVGPQMDTPAMMWDIFDLPQPLTLRKIHGPKIEIPKYPYIRDGGDSPIRELTDREMEGLFVSTQAQGKIEKSTDGKFISLLLDENFANRPLTPRYGWIVNRTDMRGLPTEQQLLSYAADDDHLQWTALNAEQPVAIVGEATDAKGTKWFHVLAYKVWGWVKAEDIALVSKEKAKQMWNALNVLTVVTPSLVVQGHFLEMGTRVRIVSESKDSFNVSISKRLPGGNLGQEIVSIRESEVTKEVGEGKFYEGRVPVSRANMVQLLFKYLGTPWAMANERRGNAFQFPHQGGDRELLIDCSGIIEKAMDAMGLYAFSRSSKWQVRQGEALWEKKEGAPPVEEALTNLGEAVWLIGMPGHVMFYLGQREGVHWMLHSPGHFRKYSSPDDFIRNGDGQAVVSPIALSRLNSKFDVLMSP